MTVAFARPSPYDLEALTPALASKLAALEARLAGLRSVVVAFSGGVDSSFLAFESARILGDRALAVTAESPSYPEKHRAIAYGIAAEFRLRHEVIQTSEMHVDAYRANPVNRCYYCKRELFEHLTALARTRGFHAVADGSNADDRGDHRPGRQAAREYGVVSPLDEVGLTKDDIRTLSRMAGLGTWDEPASACLASRIPYHDEVTEEKLRRIEQSEAVLHALGFRQCRVRHHGDVARVELARDEMARAVEPDVSTRLVRELKALGFKYVALDLQGYRLGSLNEGLPLRPV
ncbi:MAG: ATP-dependent sacrificial sulfur transferase LarE [Vicinamibacterales bacterium]